MAYIKQVFLVLIAVKLAIIYKFEKFQGPYEKISFKSSTLDNIRVLQTNISVIQDVNVSEETKTVSVNYFVYSA